MTFEEALGMMKQGASVRRQAWWPSIVRVASRRSDGFHEPVMFHKRNGEIVDYPLSLGRPDWFATDWVIVDEAGMPVGDSQTSGALDDTGALKPGS